MSMLLYFMVSLVGPRAMISYELRQAWKGATVVADSCAVVWLARATTISAAYHVAWLTKSYPHNSNADEESI